MNINSNSVRQNLIDAGCNDNEITRFLESSTTREQLLILDTERKGLIDEYHNYAKKLDCLDYLIYQLKKEKTDADKR